MFEYNKILEFCNGVGIRHEEFFLIHTIYLRNNEDDKVLFREMNVYYNAMPENTGIDYVELIHNLERKDLIRSSKMYVKGTKKIELKHLSLTDKCYQLLLCNAEEIWDKFKKLYPRTGRLSDGTEFQARIVKNGDEEYFRKYVLKTSSKLAAARVLYILEDLYDGGTLPAEMSISNFIRNWDTIQEDYENGVKTRADVGYSGYKR